jgi:hypothetical protein
MKKLIVCLIAIVSMHMAHAQSLDEIVNNHIKAIGGADNWNKVKTLVADIKMQAQGTEISVKNTQVHDKAMRTDISVMGMSGYSIVTNSEGWSFMPFQGQTKPEPMTADDVKNAQDQLSILGDFLTYKAKGKKLELLGNDDLEGTECFKISATDKEGHVTTYWLDKSSYLILKQVDKMKSNGKEVESTSTFSNYKMLPEGINYPHSMGGDWGEMEIKSVVVNSTIDETVFKPAK